MHWVHGKAIARISAHAVGALLVMAASTAALAAEPSAVSTLAGTWGGSGRITYTDGSSEGVHCNAYYSGGGNSLSMAILCRSERNPIHIRSRLRINGNRASGSWEERTFNASGTASGSVGGSSISLNIAGGGFTGSMSVSFSRSSHSVSISAQGIAMRRATLSFTKR